jgi:uncharacterized protein YegP (UPF0339 family)
MPQVTEAAEPALLDERENAQNLLATWTTVGIGMTYGASQNALVFGLPAALCALMGLTTKKHINALQRALDDPPRADYLVPTRKGHRRFDPAPLGDSSLARTTAGAVREILETSALLDAAVRAEERAQGAQLAEAGDAQALRATEAQRLMRRALASHANLATALTPLAFEWQSLSQDLPEVQTPELSLDADAITVDLLRDLPEDSQRLVRETGLSVAGIDTRAQVLAEQVRRPLRESVTRISTQTSQLAASASRVAALPESVVQREPIELEAIRPLSRRGLDAPSPAGTVQVVETAEGHAFRLIAANGQVVAVSPAHPSRASARRAASIFLENAPGAQIVERNG